MATNGSASKSNGLLKSDQDHLKEVENVESFGGQNLNELLKTVEDILNQLSAENVEELVEKIIKLKVNTLDEMKEVTNLIFEKAIAAEPALYVTYAELCNGLIDEKFYPPIKHLPQFRNALLDKLEREFNQHVAKTTANGKKIELLRIKYDQCQDTNEKLELEALIHEEKLNIRRRFEGTVCLIGEIFKFNIITGKIMHACIEALLKDPKSEHMLECLCKLLTIVGKKFEQTPIPKSIDRKMYSLKSVIQRMQNIVSNSENYEISPRIRVILQDVIDLRERNWQSAETLSIPKGHDNNDKRVALNPDSKLNVVGNACRQEVLTDDAAKLNLEPEKDDLVNRIRCILNQVTAESVEQLSDQIIKLKINTPEQMQQVTNLIFEKAINQPDLHVSYAKLCVAFITKVKFNNVSKFSKLNDTGVITTYQ